MTQEEKAKAYDEVLNKMKPLYEQAKKDGNPIWSTYEHLIPELAESEDERIRRCIGMALTDVDERRFKDFGTTLKDCLAWLEKQKEQTENATKTLAKILKDSAEGFRRILKKKGIDYEVSDKFWENTAVVYSKEDDVEFHKWMDDLMGPTPIEETYGYKKGLEAGIKQKEQKPIEYLDKDKVYAIMNKLHELAFSQLIPINSDEYKKIDEITTDVRDLLDYPIEQKPVKWSEDDEAMRKSILWVLESFVSEAECESSPSLTASYPTYYKEIDWLKSLHEKFKED